MAEVRLIEDGQKMIIELWKGTRKLNGIHFSPGEWEDLLQKIIEKDKKLALILAGELTLCGLDEPCDEGYCRENNKECHAGYTHCYVDDEGVFKENSS